MKKKPKPKPEELDENDLEIDENRLLWECRRQPKLVLVYGEMLRKAQEKLSILEDKLEFTRAAFQQKVANNPEKYGCGEKKTDFAIKQAVIRQMSVHPINRKVRLAKRRVVVLQNYMKALDNKKRQLQNLVSLHAQQWFGNVPVEERNREVLERLKNEELFASRRKKKQGSK